TTSMHVLSTNTATTRSPTVMALRDCWSSASVRAAITKPSATTANIHPMTVSAERREAMFLSGQLQPKGCAPGGGSSEEKARQAGAAALPQKHKSSPPRQCGKVLLVPKGARLDAVTVSF